MYSKKIKFLFILSVIFLSANAYAAGVEPWEGAYTSGQFANGAIRDVYCDMVGLLEGTLGGLLFGVAGLVAIAMGVFGEGGQSKNILVVAIGALTVSSLVSLYFGDLGCGSRGGKATVEKSAVVEEVQEVGEGDLF